MKNLLLCLFLLSAIARAETALDPLAPWRKDVSIRPVAPQPGRHTIHSYFNTTPESPDGRFVLFYASPAPDAHTGGEIRIIGRATGKEKLLARNITAEDAHRAACQQWVSGGKRVVFHDWHDQQWHVASVDVETAKVAELAHGRQVSWGQPNADLVPLYGPHSNPGEHRDLELLNVQSGEIRTVVTVDALKAAYPEWFASTFGDKKPSIFFPILSPDLQRVFFKMAAAESEDFRSSKASARQGLICYSLAEKRFLYMNPKWGHPSWQPDSRHITEMHYVTYDSNDGRATPNPGMATKAARAKAASEGTAAPAAAIRDVRGDHPSMSPDGKLIVTDTTMENFGGKTNEWGVVLIDARGTDQIVIHKFDNSHGAMSWRRSHPHPAFSPDGKRIYFNISGEQYTQLHVAEASSTHP